MDFVTDRKTTAQYTTIAGMGQRLSNFFKSFDAYGQAYEMKLDPSTNVRQSNFGSFLTILSFILILPFFVTKVISMRKKSEVNIYSALLENEINSEFIFDTS